MELLIGAGNSRKKKIHMDNTEWKKLVTLDYDPNTEVDVYHDLELFPYPFDDNLFDEIHAYEVLEHTGAQGDWGFFFDQFNEFHRILKPDGLFFASVPKWDSVWAFGDPSHKRVLSHASLTFLSQAEYKEQVGKTAMSDFRDIYKGDFSCVWYKYEGDNFYFILKAIK